MDLGDEISLKAAYQRLNSTHTYTEATAFRFFFFFNHCVPWWLQYKGRGYNV